MADKSFLKRQLSYITGDRQQAIAHTRLLGLAGNLVVLGEAGMGKSRLMSEISGDGVHLVSARRLIVSSNPQKLLGTTSCLLIDALDEVPSHSEGGAVDKVLSKLEEAGYPRFILSCRVEDWQAATATSVITDHYGSAPLEAFLRPLDNEQIEQFLAQDLGKEHAKEIFDEYRSRNLESWLGNPQTLEMVERVAQNGDLPGNASRLYEQYADLCWRDANEVKRENRQRELSKETTLDTLGAAFAGLLLSGKQALANPAVNFNKGDLPMADLEGMPGFADWKAISGNRLVRLKPGEMGRFTYSHRRIGEWLGARWLAKCADKPSKRDRLLARLTVNGIVPASLRGLFGWLGMHPTFTNAAISIDPMAMVEYGDADSLDAEQGTALLEALDALATQDPWFRGWGNFRAKALVHPQLLPQTMRVVTDRNRNARLRMLLAEQLEGEQISDDIADQLMAMALDGEDFFAMRSNAAAALAGNLSASSWPALIEQVRLQGTHDSIRLASEMALRVGLGHFSDCQIVDTIFTECGFVLCAVPAEGEDRMAAKGFGYREAIPDDRLGGILDLLADYASALMPEYRDLECSDAINLGKALIARRLRLGSVEPVRLLKWLEGLGGKDSYDQDDEQTLSDYLETHTDVRQAIQYQLLIDETDVAEFRMRAFRLTRFQQELALREEDIVALLGHLADGDARWRELLLLVRHSETEGAQARKAAHKFAAAEADGQHFLDRLVSPTKPDWQIENEDRAARRKAEKQQRWAEHRRNFEEDREKVRAGLFNAILAPAQAYMARFSDLDQKSGSARLADWLGEGLAGVAAEGFNNYLETLPSWPSVDEIARSYANSKYWHARDILLAAIAEKVRKGVVLSSLTNDQLIGAQLHITNHAAQNDEWKPLREAVWGELCSRPEQFEDYARLAIEPCLRKRQEHVSGLYGLVTEDHIHRDVIVRLAGEWLDRMPRMHWRPEEELIDLLLREGEHEKLLQVSKRRLRSKALTDERRRNWQAVTLIVDFQKLAPKLSGIASKDRDFLWTIRARLGGRRRETIGDEVETQLAVWIIEEFRAAYPLRSRPSGVTSGDVNPWDATDYLSRLIDRIGADVSQFAVAALESLAKVDDGYRDRILAVLAEQHRKRAEQEHLTISLDELSAILDDDVPQSLPDMRTYMLELLNRVEAQVCSNDTDSWRGFYGPQLKPYDEERCRDHLVDLLRQHEQTIEFVVEDHVGDDREIDISCRLSSMRLPVEIKGQWHAALWSAADNQLDRQQAVDHQAQGHGIFLVLWFGDAGKKLRGPPRGSGIERPDTPQELERALAGWSNASKRGQIIIKVVDLSRASD